MIAPCRKDKNVRSLHLKLVAYFKMKWEAMYQRELTTESYGKRGISWHGFLIIYFLWDEDTGAPMRHVLKLDQILEGANKRDVVTVLALLEAAIVFVSDEFGQDVVIDCLQTDSAAAYLKKELVLGIAILNAVSTNVRVYFLVLGMLRFVTHHLIACLYRKRSRIVVRSSRVSFTPRPRRQMLDQRAFCSCHLQGPSLVEKCTTKHVEEGNDTKGACRCTGFRRGNAKLRFTGREL
jgi:hypothetical protein